MLNKGTVYVAGVSFFGGHMDADDLGERLPVHLFARKRNLPVVLKIENATIAEKEQCLRKAAA